MARILHICAENDVNGNPQRLYALMDGDSGKILASWDEGYRGHHAVPGPWRRDAYNAVKVHVNELYYKQVLDTTPHPEWAHEVKGYEHLREWVTVR